MAILKKRVNNQIHEFLYDQYGLDENRNYKIIPPNEALNIELSPDGYTNNIKELKYNCETTVKNLLADGKTIISTSEAETEHTLWGKVRDGIRGSVLNDIIYSSYNDDKILADLGDDFIEIDNYYVEVNGDEYYIHNPYEGGNDVIMIRCGDIVAAGNGKSDHYFVNINKKCIELGHAKNIVITDISHNDDTNKLHLCDFNFQQNSKDNVIDNLANNGIRLATSNDNLEIYFKNNSIKDEPDIIIDFFCNNFGIESINPPIASIVDRNGNEISLQGLDCKTIQEYMIIPDFIKPHTNEASSNDCISLNSTLTDLDYIGDCVQGLVEISV